MVELRVPPLRDRLEDIPEFIDFFSRKFAAQYGRPLWQPSAETLKQFCEFNWPGNVRQLSHIIEQSYILSCEPALPNHDAPSRAMPPLPFMDLAKLRSAAVRQALHATRGHKGRAAKLLGVHANTMTRILSQMEEEGESLELVEEPSPTRGRSK
jgi:DNA-binding NtrC family response regulator